MVTERNTEEAVQLQDTEVQITDQSPEPEVTQEEAQPDVAPVSGEEAVAAPAAEPPQTGAVPEPPAPPAAAPDPLAGEAGRKNLQELEELHKLRQVNAQKEWEQTILRRAQNVERQAQQQGIEPQTARQMARQYIGHQKELRDQEDKALNLIGFVEGKNNAALHFGNKYGLIPKQALDDLVALTRFQSPQEMEHEARRIQQHRKQAAEITRLKQGQVAPQTFDNSQGSAEATTNQDRLLDAYLAGDRSDAAVRAARRLTLGN